MRKNLVVDGNEIKQDVKCFSEQGTEKNISENENVLAAKSNSVSRGNEEQLTLG